LSFPPGVGVNGIRQSTNFHRSASGFVEIVQPTGAPVNQRFMEMTASDGKESLTRPEFSTR